MKLEIIILLLVTSGLCKNIDKRNRGYSSSDYGYNYPVAYPPFSDELSTTPLPHFSYGPPMDLDLPKPNQTIPPNQADFPDDSYLPPDITLQAPQFDPLPIDDTVVIPLPPTNQYLPSANPNQYDTAVARLKVSNMSCMDDPVRGYFRASMTATRVITVPVIDDALADCVTVTGNVFRLNLEGERMKKCAVRFCANGVNMCVTIRVPSIKGLKLGDDTLLTLRCRPQERVVSHTKHFKINTKNLVHQARSMPTVATGGSQRNFDTHVSLYRKSSTGRDFTVPVDSGSAVQLGEELLLRTTVKDGDGWRFSRMGEVLMHHVSNSGQVQQRALTLVDSAGCRDIRMRAVCPDNPVQTSPLVSTLALRAFMFQGMASGDEMVMSVRVVACVHYEDCHSKTRTCDGKFSKAARTKRDTNSTPTRTSDWQSYVEFRVVTPHIDVKNDVARGQSFNVVASSAPKAIYLFTLLISGCLSAVAVVAALIAGRAVRKNKCAEQH